MILFVFPILIILEMGKGGYFHHMQLLDIHVGQFQHMFQHKIPFFLRFRVLIEISLHVL